VSVITEGRPDQLRDDLGKWADENAIKDAVEDPSKARELLARFKEPAKREALAKALKDAGMTREDYEKAVGGGSSVNPKVLEWARKKFGDEEKAKNFAEWFGDSKVVDEDGNPLVVYHGTSRAFDEFSKERGMENTLSEMKGIPTYYSTSNADMAGSYAAGETPSIMPVYVRMEKPLIVDAEGREWFESLEAIDDGLLTYRTDAEKAVAEIRHEISETFKDEIKYGIEFEVPQDMQQRFDTASAAFDKELMAKTVQDKPIKGVVGYDGIIVKNSFDWTAKGVQDPEEYDWSDLKPINPFGDVVITLDPNQIKSATGNRGTFDPASNKINESSTVNRLQLNESREADESKLSQRLAGALDAYSDSESIPLAAFRNGVVSASRKMFADAFYDAAYEVLDDFLSKDSIDTEELQELATDAAIEQSTTLGEQMAETTDNWVQNGTYADYAFSDDRCDVVAITEITRAQSRGRLAAMAILEELGIRTLAVWETALDERVCPLCGPNHNQDERFWGENYPEGPPVHPRCRCQIQVVERKTRRKPQRRFKKPQRKAPTTKPAGRGKRISFKRLLGPARRKTKARESVELLEFREDQLRADDGRWITEQEIAAAATDVAKARELLSQVQEPEKREALATKLRDAGMSKADYAKAVGGGSTVNPKVLEWAKKKFGDEIQAKNFATWFGDSKAVDENGEPLVVYHGAEDVGFDEFKISNKPSEPGIFFTDNPGNADGYHSYGPGGGAGAGSGTYPVFVSMQNPLVVDWEDYAKKSGSPSGNRYNPSSMARLFREAKLDKHDGIIIKGISDSGYFGKGDPISDNYVVFASNQVKSATGNKGTYSRDSNKLNESRKLLEFREDQLRDDLGQWTVEGEIAEAAKDVSKARVLLDKFKKPENREKIATALRDAGMSKEDYAKAVGSESSVNPKVLEWARRKFKDETTAKNFATWFGDSKVVDENGEPLVVYHGAKTGFDEFDPTKTSSGESAFFFTTNKEYASNEAKTRKGGGSVLPVYLASQNPNEIDYQGGDWSGDKQDLQTSISGGFDGMIRRNVQSKLWGVKFDEYVVFSPNQIKSATANRGTYSRDSNKINEQTSGLTDKSRLNEGCRCCMDATKRMSD